MIYVIITSLIIALLMILSVAVLSFTVKQISQWESKMKYYYILCRVSSFLDTEVNFNVVISEEPEEFALRMKEEMATDECSDLNDQFEMLQWKQISKSMYDKLKVYNPSNESGLSMKREDYGYYVEEEEEDTEG